jgi:hypothetical protein
MHSTPLTHATNGKVAPSEHAAPTSDRSSKYPESCCRSGNEKLLTDAYQLVLKHADRHYMGNRLSPQSAHDIRQGLVLLLSRYEIRPRS